MDNSGTFNLIGAQLGGYEGAGEFLFDNLAAGTFNSTGNSYFSGIYLGNGIWTGTFDNAGTFNVNGGTAAFDLNFDNSTRMAFNNTGEVNVTGGSLEIESGGTSSGPMSVSLDAGLTFASGYTFLVGASVSGAGGVTFANIIGSSAGTYTFAAGQFLPTGPLNFSGGTVTINNPVMPASLGPITATVTFNQVLNYPSPVTVGGFGSASFAKTEPFTNLTVSSGSASFSQAQSLVNLTLNNSGQLSSGGTLTVTGTLSDLSGGAIYGAGKLVIPSTATANISSTLGLGLEVDNSGTFDMTGGRLGSYEGPGEFVFNNLSGGTFNASGNAEFLGIFQNGWGGTLNNYGTFNSTGGMTTFDPAGNGPGVAFNNSGIVNVTGGTLALLAGGQFAGQPAAVRTQPGTTINVVGNVSGNTQNSSLFAPLGTLNMSGGSFGSPDFFEAMSTDLGFSTSGFPGQFWLRHSSSFCQ